MNSPFAKPPFNFLTFIFISKHDFAFYKQEIKTIILANIFSLVIVINPHSFIVSLSVLNKDFLKISSTVFNCLFITDIILVNYSYMIPYHNLTTEFRANKSLSEWQRILFFFLLLVKIIINRCYYSYSFKSLIRANIYNVLS